MQEITGRDDYIIEQALFFAVHTIDGLPPEYQARSNRADMLKMLRARTGDQFHVQAELFGRTLEGATGRRLNLVDD